MKYKIIKSETNEDANYMIEEPQWTIQEVILAKNITENIEEITAFVTNRDTLFKEWGFNRFMKTGGGLSVNFFGPPGTGKSVTAEAIASKLGMRILKINYADLESKYVGETSKNLSEVFQKAEETNSLLFFDEADAVLGKRISNLNHAADHGVNMTKGTLATLMDKFQGVIIFATNLFENYDEAFLRRILFHLEFPLPTFEMRVELWKLHLSQNIPKAISYERAAELSDNLSGGDIRNVAIKLCLQLIANKIGIIDEDSIKKQIENLGSAKGKNKKLTLIEQDVI